MIRRTHRKSRNGCAQCKRRHVKCDEVKPRCVNCTTAGTGDCTYPTKIPKATATTRNSDTNSESSSPNANPNANPNYHQSIFSVTPTATPSNDATNESPNISSSGAARLPLVLPGQLPGDYVNVTHLELFYHFALENSPTFFAREFPKDLYSTLLRYAFSAKYLLYETLALSSLHLSFITPSPEKTQYYREEAEKLQTEALRLYNKVVPNINDDNLIPAFIYSGLLGIHFFCNVFLTPADNLDGFLDELVQSIRLLQGVRAVLTGGWEKVLNSDIKPLLEAERPENVNYSDEVLTRLENLIPALKALPQLSPDQGEVIAEAVKLLCWAYKAQVTPDCSEGNGNPRMVTSWPVIISPKFSDLLTERKPEAIIVLAYFSILLHQCRNWWAVGGSGQFLLGAVELFLGAEWEAWLAWPKLMVYQNG